MQKSEEGHRQSAVKIKQENDELVSTLNDKVSELTDALGDKDMLIQVANQQI